MSNSSILVADVGGTNARIGYLREPWGPGVRLDEGLVFRMESVEFDTFEDFVRAALVRLGIDGGGIDAVFSVAGPVTNGCVHLTNLDWAPADEKQLREAFGFRRCRLVNDLVAAAWGLTGIEPGSRACETLQQGSPPGADSRQVLLNVGTGLGVAYWSGEGDRFHVDGSEAGHIGFAPPPEAVGLLGSMQARYGRVSWERVLAGNGLAELYRYYVGESAGSSPEVVTRAQRGDTAALESVSKYSYLLGTYAGDIALAAPALGGVYLVGGVVDGLGVLLRADRFLEGFISKGRMEPLLRAVPVFKITEPRLGLTGAWRIASIATPVR